MVAQNCPRLYIKNMEIDFLETFEGNIEKCAPNSWQIPGYVPDLP